jgi:Minichromosome loss protein, Mcl1, middle region
LIWQGETDDNNDERLLIACADGNLVILNGRENIVPQRQVVIADDNILDDKQIESLKTSTKLSNDGKKEDSSDKTTTATKKKNAQFEDLGEPNGVDSVKDTASRNNVQPAVLTKQLKERNKHTFDDDDDDDNIGEDDDADSPSRNSTKNSRINEFIDDEADDDDDSSKTERGTTNKGYEIGRTTGQNKNMIDEFDNASADDDSYDGDRVKRYHGSSKNGFIMDLPECQAPFGVSSTPLDLPRRFLCWNHIGSVTLVQGTGGSEDTNVVSTRNTIDIHFTNSFSRRNITFTDNLGFILGSLGEDGAIFATDVADDDDDNDDNDNDGVLGDDYLRGLSNKTKEAVKRAQRSKKDLDKATGSTLYFNRFETFGNVRDKDWVLTLPSGERVVGCACGEGWAAAITRYVHVRLTKIPTRSKLQISDITFSCRPTRAHLSIAAVSFDCSRQEEIKVIFYGFPESLSRWLVEVDLLLSFTISASH